MSVRVGSVLLLAGCGRLAGGDYLGEPLFSLSGNVTDDGATRDLDLRVALFWANDGAESEEAAVVVTTRFPAEYTLEIYAYPPDDVRFDAPWDPGHRYAIGTPLVYADQNRDQRWNVGEEPVLGGSSQVVLFSEAATDGVAANGVVAPITEGFSRVWADQTVSVCGGGSGEMFVIPTAEEPTDLSVGYWWTNLYDWDCDGEYDEWKSLCPQIADFETWCEDPTNAGDVCAAYCQQDPGPDGQLNQ